MILNSDIQCSVRILIYLNVSGKISERGCILQFCNQWLEPASAHPKWNLLSGKNLWGSKVKRLKVQRQIWWLFVLDISVKIEGFRIFSWGIFVVHSKNTLLLRSPEKLSVGILDDGAEGWMFKDFNLSTSSLISLLG